MLFPDEAGKTSSLGFDRVRHWHGMTRLMLCRRTGSMRPRNIGGSGSWVVLVAYLETCSFEVTGFLGKCHSGLLKFFPARFGLEMSCPFEKGSDVYFVSTTCRYHNFCTATTYRHNGNSILCIVPFCFFAAGNRFPSTRFSKHTNESY